MAHRLIGRLYETRGNAVKAREHLSRAFEFRANLTQKERFQVEASYFKGRGEYDQAVQTLTAATNLFPSDGDARYELALAYRDAGQASKAVEQLELTLKNAPLTTAAYGDLVLLLARAGAYDGARAAYDAARTRNVSSPKLDWAYAMVLLGEGRTAEARKQLDAVGTASAFTPGPRAYTLPRRTSSTESFALPPSGWSPTFFSTARTRTKSQSSSGAICSHARCCCRGGAKRRASNSLALLQHARARSP